MRQTTLLLALTFFVVCNASAQGPEWYAKVKQVTFLTTSAQDVIRIFDLPSKLKDYQNPPRYVWSVDMESGKFIISFKEGAPCTDRSRLALLWNAPEWSLIQMVFIPDLKKGLTLDQLPFATSGFEKYELSAESSTKTRYANDTDGIWFDVNADKKVTYIDFSPPASLRYALCSRKENN